MKWKNICTLYLAFFTLWGCNSSSSSSNSDDSSVLSSNTTSNLISPSYATGPWRSECFSGSNYHTRIEVTLNGDDYEEIVNHYDLSAAPCDENALTFKVRISGVVSKVYPHLEIANLHLLEIEKQREEAMVFDAGLYAQYENTAFTSAPGLENYGELKSDYFFISPDINILTYNENASDNILGIISLVSSNSMNDSGYPLDLTFFNSFILSDLALADDYQSNYN